MYRYILGGVAPSAYYCIVLEMARYLISSKMNTGGAVDVHEIICLLNKSYLHTSHEKSSKFGFINWHRYTYRYMKITMRNSISIACNTSCKSVLN